MGSWKRFLRKNKTKFDLIAEETVFPSIDQYFPLF
jgi:hypothetical protein